MVAVPCWPTASDAGSARAPPTALPDTRHPVFGAAPVHEKVATRVSGPPARAACNTSENGFGVGGEADNFGQANAASASASKSENLRIR